MPGINNGSSAVSKKECCNLGKCCGCNGFAKKFMLTLAGVLLVYGIFYTGTLIRNNLKKFEYIGKADRMERTVMVNGYGKVTGRNDIAVTSIGYSNVNKDVAKAQADNKAVMDKVVADLQKIGIADKDMQTNYTIYPEYNYTQEKGQELKGYRVTNTITVKIRNLAKISDILSLAGKYGATEVSGLSFTIDDPENLKAEARDKALADAKTRVARLAQTLGVRLGGVVAYNEYEGGTDYYPRALDMMSAEGGGGGAPEVVAGGSKDVIMNISVTYAIGP